VERTVVFDGTSYAKTMDKIARTAPTVKQKQKTKPHDRILERCPHRVPCIANDRVAGYAFSIFAFWQLNI
jgi:hypothetical protein